MTIEKVNTPWITLGHILTTVGLLGGLLAYANSTENKVVENEAKQEAIQKAQDEMKGDFKAFRIEQRQVQQSHTELLHQIKGKLEAK